MVNPGIVCGLIMMTNCLLTSGSILKMDPSSVHLYKSGLRNEIDYILKRSGIQSADESPDSKERRSQMGTSFIRFGRSHSDGNQENSDNYSANDLDPAVRPVRGRSDVIIRFGRDGNNRDKIVKVLPINLEKLIYTCPDILTSGDSSVELIRLCASLTFGSLDKINE